jgi:hypothetical protein
VNRLNFIQGKKEEDSDVLLRRCFFIYQNRDDWLKALYPAEYPIALSTSTGQMIGFARCR